MQVKTIPPPTEAAAPMVGWVALPRFGLCPPDFSKGLGELVGPASYQEQLLGSLLSMYWGSECPKHPTTNKISLQNADVPQSLKVRN